MVLTVDIFLPTVAAFPYSGYNPAKKVISMLGSTQSPWSKGFNIWMVAVGIVMVLLGGVFFLYYRQVNRGLAALLFVLFLLHGVGDGILSGLFPLNEENRNNFTTVHGVASAVGFTALLLILPVLAVLEWTSGAAGAALWTLFLFLVGAVAFVLFAVGNQLHFKKGIFTLEGLWQRTACWVCYLPLMYWLLVRL